MRRFNAWPVFFKREWNRNWPFLVGFAITGILITKFSFCLTGRMRRTRLLYRGTRRSSGAGSGGQVAKDALGNDVIAAEWLKTHGPGDRTLSHIPK